MGPAPACDPRGSIGKAPTRGRPCRARVALSPSGQSSDGPLAWQNGQVEWRTGQPTSSDIRAALAVWRAAKEAKLDPPDDERILRVGEKLQAADACVVTGWDGGEALAMAMAEPGSEGDGTGPIVPGHGHVSMVFVHPGSWGHGVGQNLLAAVHREATRKRWGHLTLWTGQANLRARRLYERLGYRATGRVRNESLGTSHIQYEIELAASRRPSDPLDARI
jgi:GNAT superfamily N-acetyltransferase